MIGPPKILYKLFRYRCFPWLQDYVAQQRRRRIQEKGQGGGRTQLFLSLVDHFEPARSLGELGVVAVEDWCGEYERMASQFTDLNGRHPQHTWFYRYDYPEFRCLSTIARSVFRGFGEIEFHLHHGSSTQEWFANTINSGCKWFSSAGAMISQGPIARTNFGYIAGNWALDNGQGKNELSGVDDELSVLARYGCYADFTFPAFGAKSQPPMANNIYMTDATPFPKSYAKGRTIQAGKAVTGDLMIFQGPVYIDMNRGYIDYAAIESFAPYFSERLSYWTKAGVSVVGKPDWIFVKLHTHGMQSKKEVLGDNFVQLLKDISELESQGVDVHYVTARESCNLVLAAAQNLAGEPSDFFDFEIPRPINRDSFVSFQYIPVKFDEMEFHIKCNVQNGGTILLSRGPVECLEFDGSLKELKIEWASGCPAQIRFRGGGSIVKISQREGLEHEIRIDVSGAGLELLDLSG